MPTVLNDDDATVVVCPECQRAVIVSMTRSMGRFEAEEMGRMILDGFEIRHMPVEDARKLPLKCEC